MLLTVSKRLEFSASRRLNVAGWSDKENTAAFGPETNARYGSGRNYTAYFVFTGPVDQATGMLINISEIKERAGKVLHEGFDHKFLNLDNPSFREIPPTAENVARQLYGGVSPLFADGGATLCVCHLRESPDRSDVLFHRRLRSELLVRILSGAQNDVAAPQPGGKRQVVWAGYCSAWTQLSLPAHISSRTTQF